MENARVHGKGNPREIGCFPIQTHAAATIRPGYCAIRIFFGSLKIHPGRRLYTVEDELYEALNEILTGFSVEMMETVFIDWMNRLQRLIDGNGNCVSENITNEFLN
jgi:hypothetical protein